MTGVNISAEDKKLDPVDYFEYIKNLKKIMDSDYLKKLYGIVMSEAQKAKQTGQNILLRRLAYSISVLHREEELLRQGINVFVFREDIEKFIKSVNNKVVKVIELEYFPRSIPNEIADRIHQLKQLNLFDKFYIVFTDYTGEVESQVKAEERRKDPIIFGTFETLINGMWDIHDRFYYVADWEDEYCDLTLAKMVDTMAVKGTNILKEMDYKKSEEALRSYVASLIEDEKTKNAYKINIPKKSFFQKVKLFFKG